MLHGFDTYYNNTVVNANLSTQIAQWAFFQSAEQRTAFLVFKGTDMSNPQDVLADLGMLPAPMFPTDGAQEKEISGHALMTVTVARDYYKMTQHILKCADGMASTTCT